MSNQDLSTHISPSLLNFEKTDYTKGDLFFAQQLGLMDTINRHYPGLEKLYKRLKAMDWDEHEFPLESCKVEFKRMAPKLAQPMINQIGWQWETDTIAARMVGPIMSGFLTDQTAVDLYNLITVNETVHGRAYSEIVKFSFDDPNAVMGTILEIKEHRQRLSVVAEVFEKAFIASHELTLNIRKRDQETYEIFFLFVVALFIMERGQFMSSFPITFTYGANDHYMPINKFVQKICQDEYEIHAVAGAQMLDHMLSTGPGLTASIRHKHTIEKMVKEVWAIEANNIDFLLGGLPNLFGVTQQDYRNQVDFFFGDIARFLRVNHDVLIPKASPISFLDKWINISSIQAALQEEKNGQYLLGAVQRDDFGKVYEVAGL